MKSNIHPSKQLDAQKDKALDLMKNAGYEITQKVTVMIDPSLTFMGYTTEQDGHPLIVVSENAMKGDMAINLLVHELSHVYRLQSKHPSHDYELLTSIATWVMRGHLVYDAQEKILHTILNHLQDLYADDISFNIFKTDTQQQDLNEFFLSWIHEPSKAEDPAIRAWENADNLLSTAFAAANLERHSITDTDGKVAKAVSKFLDKVGEERMNKFHFFKEFMIRLPEDVTHKEFEKLLIAYLSEFLKLTKIA
jgi:hypothetical protein